MRTKSSNDDKGTNLIKHRHRKIRVDSTTLVIDKDGKDIPIRKPKVTPKNAVAMIFIPSFDFLLIELK